MTPPLAITTDSASATRPVLREIRAGAHAAPVARKPDSRTPNHVAAVLSHSAPLEVLIDGALNAGIEFLSLKITQDFSALAAWLHCQAASLPGRGVRLLGLNNCPVDGAPRAVLQMLAQLPQPCPFATHLTMTLAIGYDTKRDIASAAAACAARNRLPTAAELLQHMAARDLPPIDLVLHAAGCHRLQAFLLWHAAYAELGFLETPWNRFGPDDLRAALDQYAGRNRTFGAVPAR